jgi:hypothetical protein
MLRNLTRSNFCLSGGDRSENDCAENHPGNCVYGSATGSVSGTWEIWHSCIFISFISFSPTFPRCAPSLLDAINHYKSARSSVACGKYRPISCKPLRSTGKSGISRAMARHPQSGGLVAHSPPSSRQRFVEAACELSGRATKNVEPCPSVDLSQMRPPCASTSSRQR